MNHHFHRQRRILCLILFLMTALIVSCTKAQTPQGTSQNKPPSVKQLPTDPYPNPTHLSDYEKALQGRTEIPRDTMEIQTKIVDLNQTIDYNDHDHNWEKGYTVDVTRSQLESSGRTFSYLFQINRSYGNVSRNLNELMQITMYDETGSLFQTIEVDDPTVGGTGASFTGYNNYLTVYTPRTDFLFLFEGTDGTQYYTILPPVTLNITPS